MDFKMGGRSEGKTFELFIKMLQDKGWDVFGDNEYYPDCLVVRKHSLYNYYTVMVDKTYIKSENLSLIINHLETKFNEMMCEDK